MSHPKLFTLKDKSFFHELFELKAKKSPIFLLSIQTIHEKMIYPSKNGVKQAYSCTGKFRDDS
jgi:hypothetical protein